MRNPFSRLRRKTGFCYMIDNLRDNCYSPIRKQAMNQLVDIISARIMSGFAVHLKFEDGVEGIIDLEHHLQGPALEPLCRNRELFESLRVDPESGTIVWQNGADIAQDTLYEEIKTMSAIPA